MRRYSGVLLQAWEEATGQPVRSVAPSDFVSRRVRGARLRKFVRYLEQLAFAVTLPVRRRHADLVHVADHSDAPYLLVPGMRGSLITCHDLIAVRAARGDFPERRVRATGRVYQAGVLAGLRRAGLVLAVSQATAGDLHALGVGSSVQVLHNPVDPGFTRPEHAPVTAPIDGPYFLVVSGSSWRKARDDALRVFASLWDEKPWTEHLLVIVGGGLTPSERRIVRGVQDRVVIRTWIPDEELRALYRGASALLLLSKYEGFGWPGVEANAQGTPVIARRTSVLEETVGKAGVFLRMDGDLVAQTSDLAPRLEAARAAARANAERFGWQPFVGGLRALLRAPESRP